MADPITAYLTNLGFPQIMLWLLSFAAIYGITKQANVPKDKSARAIIAIVAAFFVIMATPTTLINVIEKMSQSLILIVLGLLLLIVFFEVAGVKVMETVEFKDDKGNKHEKQVPVRVFDKYGKYFAIVFIIIAILVFIGSGGMGLLGFSFALSGVNTMTLLFFIILILAVMWMIFEKGGE